MEPHEIHLLHSGKLATLRALIHAIVETHPNRAELASAFAQKAQGLECFIRDYEYEYATKETRSDGRAVQYLKKDIDYWLSLVNAPTNS